MVPFHSKPLYNLGNFQEIPDLIMRENSQLEGQYSYQYWSVGAVLAQRKGHGFTSRSTLMYQNIYYLFGVISSGKSLLTTYMETLRYTSLAKFCYRKW